jgi:hypothetical protein
MKGVEALDQRFVGCFVAIVHPDLMAVRGEEGPSPIEHMFDCQGIRGVGGAASMV